MSLAVIQSGPGSQEHVTGPAVDTEAPRDPATYIPSFGAPPPSEFPVVQAPYKIDSKRHDKRFSRSDSRQWTTFRARGAEHGIPINTRPRDLKEALEKPYEHVLSGCKSTITIHVMVGGLQFLSIESMSVY